RHGEITFHQRRVRKGLFGSLGYCFLERVNKSIRNIKRQLRGLPTAAAVKRHACGLPAVATAPRQKRILR
ncbi:MAG: hypothetical protein II629_01915, partial [Ruminococcus sp.]|nr:hypothetical protein [Ruminococcus sp.]